MKEADRLLAQDYQGMRSIRNRRLQSVVVAFSLPMYDLANSYFCGVRNTKTSMYMYKCNASTVLAVDL